MLLVVLIYIIYLYVYKEIVKILYCCMEYMQIVNCFTVVDSVIVNQIAHTLLFDGPLDGHILFVRARSDFHLAGAQRSSW